MITPEELAARVFCCMDTAKRKNLEMAFARLAKDGKGRTLPLKLINHALAENHLEFDKATKEEMAAAVEMLRRDPTLAQSAADHRVDEIASYIHAQGGIAKMRADYRKVRREEQALTASASQGRRIS